MDQGLVPFDHEVIEMLRRIDKDDDGIVSRAEFEEFISLIENVHVRPPPPREAEVERETTVTRSLDGSEIVRETVTRTVDRDAVGRSPRALRSVRKSFGPNTTYTTTIHEDRPYSRVYTTEVVRPSQREEVVIETEVPARGFSRTYRTVRRSVSRSPEKEVVETRVTNYSSAPRRSPSRGREERFSRSRDVLSKVRKNREDVEYSEWVHSRDPLTKSEAGGSPRSRRSTRDLAASSHSSRRSIKRSPSFDLTADFVSYLRLAARLESELDSLKQELCLRPDYNSYDHFRCLDTLGRGYIREADLGLFLRDIDPTITSE